MDERALLLLGMLRVQSQHGYQINEFIERALGRVTDMKKPTAYAILERLSQGGYVRVHSEQEGGRPPRKVYALTPAGEQHFYELLREQLAAPQRTPAAGGIALLFLDDLPADERVALVRRRLEALGEVIATYEVAPRHGHGLGVDLAIEQQRHILRAEQDGLGSTLLPRLERERDAAR